MIQYYSYNNGKKWAIKIGGPRFKWTKENLKLVEKAPNNWNSKEEAMEWVKAHS